MHDAHPSPSETLRRAASLMRERAEACPAAVDANNWSDEAAEHIASWHPTVALAVADLLDLAVTHQVGFTPAPRKHLLTIARAYLGSDA